MELCQRTIWSVCFVLLLTTRPSRCDANPPKNGEVLFFKYSPGECRDLHFLIQVRHKALKGHTIRSVQVESEESCMDECYAEKRCASYNLSPFQDGFHTCELSDSNDVLHPDDLQQHEEYLFRAVKNPCNERPCQHGSACLAGFTPKGYQCLCPERFRGEHCEVEVISYFMAEHAENCDIQCGKHGMECDPKGFSGKNVKELFEGLGFLCETEEGYVDADQPCYALGEKHCYGTSGLPEKIHCASGGNGAVRRLCPCH